MNEDPLYIANLDGNCREILKKNTFLVELEQKNAGFRAPCCLVYLRKRSRASRNLPKIGKTLLNSQ